MRARYILEIFYFIYCVVMQARLTKAELMIAVAHVNLQIFIFCFKNLTFTYLTCSYILNTTNCYFKFTPENSSNFRLLHSWFFLPNFIRFRLRILTPEQTLQHRWNSLTISWVDRDVCQWIFLSLRILSIIISDRIQSLIFYDITLSPF